jgi:hypothetical protein
MHMMTLERVPAVATRKTPVTSLSLPTAVRDQASELAIDLSTQLRRRVSMAAVIAAALTLAAEQPAAVAAILTRSDPAAPSEG